MKICPNCQKKNPLEATTCEFCGHEFEGKTLTTESPIDLFVGKKANYYKEKWEKAEEGNGITFNLSAFLFTFLWLGYRKHYRPIVYAALGFLGIDFLVYLSGYQQSITTFSPLDRAISTAVAVTIGMYGNVLYKKYVEEKIQTINESTTDESERKKLYAEKGQTSWLGVGIAILIMGGLYIIPSIFIPVNVDPIEAVQFAEIEYVENTAVEKVTIKQMTDSIFENPHWEDVSESQTTEALIRFEGDYSENHFILLFELNEDSDSVEIIEFLIDGSSLETYTDLHPFDFLINLYLANDSSLNIKESIQMRPSFGQRNRSSK